MCRVRPHEPRRHALVVHVLHAVVPADAWHWRGRGIMPVGVATRTDAPAGVARRRVALGEHRTAAPSEHSARSAEGGVDAGAREATRGGRGTAGGRCAQGPGRVMYATERADGRCISTRGTLATDSRRALRRSMPAARRSWCSAAAAPAYRARPPRVSGTERGRSSAGFRKARRSRRTRAVHVGRIAAGGRATARSRGEDNHRLQQRNAPAPRDGALSRVGVRRHSPAPGLRHARRGGGVGVGAAHPAGGWRWRRWMGWGRSGWGGRRYADAETHHSVAKRTANFVDYPIDLPIRHVGPRGQADAVTEERVRD